MTPFLTKTDHAADAPRAAIASGQIPPGEWIRAEDWARRLHLSVTPVREALRQLEALGLVTIRPHRNAQVTKRTRAELMEEFGYGIIGCGWVAPGHAVGVRALRGEGVRLVAAADADRGRLDVFADEFAIPHRYADYRDLLARDDVQAVSICLPDFLHHDVALAALQAGKHVLCEKPLAMSIAEADAMIASAGARDRTLSIIFNHRYRLPHRRLHAAARAGAFGDLLIGYVFHSSEVRANPGIASTWRKRSGQVGGGVLTMQTVHFLDILMWAIGRPVRSVRATVANRAHGDEDVEDVGAFIAEFEGGALVTVAATNASPMEDLTRMELHGTEGYAVLEGYDIQQWKVRPDYEEPADVALPEAVISTADRARLFFGTGHVQQVAEFIRDLRAGRSPAVPASAGRDTVAVLHAVYESARRGVAVSLAEIHEADASAEMGS